LSRYQQIKFSKVKLNVLKIWKLHTNKTESASVYIGSYEEADYYTNIFEQQFNTNSKITDNWQETLIYNITDVDFAKFLFSGKEIWLCSEKAKQLIEPLLIESVEFLPLLQRDQVGEKISIFKRIFQRKAFKPVVEMIPEQTFYMLNITNILSTEVIDFKQSDVEVDKNGCIYTVEKLAFKPQLLKKTHLFKIENESNYFKTTTFISNELKQIIENNKLTGFTFIERPEHEGGSLVWDGNV